MNAPQAARPAPADPLPVPADAPALRHVDSLDGWRGLAILCLLTGHFFPVPGINFGTIGVSLFFVLSGLLMAGLLFEKREPLVRFYRRRIARILPAHLLFVSLITLAWFVLDQPFSRRELLSALLFVNNYVAPEHGPGTAVMPFGHIWSLSVEEHSYVALSLVAIAARRVCLPAAAGVGGLFLACIGFALVYQWLNPPDLAYTLWLHSEVAAYGLLGAACWVATGRKPALHRLPAWSAPLLVLAGIALHWWSVPPLLQRLLGTGCFIAALGVLSFGRGWFARLLCLAPLRQLGLWSYSLYLWQQPFYLWRHADPAMPAALACALAIGCGLISYYGVERPARNWLNRHWGARAGRPTNMNL